MLNISIIIPIYNAARFIEDCLQSVANQTMTEGVECILVDDCGTDNSVALAEEYIANYQGHVQFILLHQERNQGPSAARNAGTRAAQGKYIFFLDADDKITPDCIERLNALTSENDADYVQGTYVSDEHYHMPIYGNEIPRFSDDKKWIKSTLLNYMVIPFTPHNRLVRRQLILDHNLFFNEKIKVREDFYWMFFMAKHVKRMAICDFPTYYRGYNADSLTHAINMEREVIAYRTLIEDFCANIDPFLPGHQKALILDTLIMMLRGGYYEDDKDKECSILRLRKVNKPLERLLLDTFLILPEGIIRTRVLHLLLKLYKRD